MKCWTDEFGSHVLIHETTLLPSALCDKSRFHFSCGAREAVSVCKLFCSHGLLEKANVVSALISEISGRFVTSQLHGCIGNANKLAQSMLAFPSLSRLSKLMLLITSSSPGNMVFTMDRLR